MANWTRRDAVKAGIGAGVALTGLSVPAWAAMPGPASQALNLITRAIPSSGEKLPIVGMGTARNYENPSPEQLPPLREVIRAFPEMGGKVLDTAPSYGRAEQVVGDFMKELGNRDKYFIATKVSVGGRGGSSGPAAEVANASLARSLDRFHTDHIDLMQVWNLSAPDQLLPILEEWKAAKKVRYVGVTTSFPGQYAALEALMNARKFDFIQIDLAIDNRAAQERILPLAMDKGFGVLINLPFGRGRPFQKTAGKPLPGWAKEIDATDWSQVFLKYILGNPAVTCVIPGTEKVEYLKLNLAAATGRLPDAALRRRMEQDFDKLAGAA